MMGKLKEIWEQFPAEDRRLIRLMGIICGGLLVLTLVALTAILLIMPPEEPGPKQAFTTPDTEQPQKAETPDIRPIPEASAKAGTPEMKAESIATVAPGEEKEREVIPDLKLQPLDITAHREIIEIYSNQREYGRVLPHIERIAPRFKEDLQFQSNAGEAYLKSGMPQKAVEHFNRALKLSPNDPKIAADLGLSLFRSQQPEPALKGIRKHLQKHPGDATLKTVLASMLGELDSSSTEADELFKEVIQENPDYTEAYYQYARKQINQGNFGHAHRLLETAVKQEPLSARIRARFGMVLFYLKRDKAAEREYRTALALNKRDYNTWFNLGELYLTYSHESFKPKVIQSENRKALTCFLNTVAIDRNHPSGHYKIGLLLNNNRQFKEAIHHLEIAKSGMPEDIPTLLQLSIAWEALGYLNTSLELLTSAYELDPFNRVVAAKLRSLRLFQSQNAGKKQNTSM